MWIKRHEYERLRELLIRAEIRLEITEKQLLSQQEFTAIYQEKADVLSKTKETFRLRIGELEAAILAANDSLVKERVRTPTKIHLDFDEEDEDLVRRDREFIKKEGTSDPLLAADVGEM